MISNKNSHRSQYVMEDTALALRASMFMYFLEDKPQWQQRLDAAGDGEYDEILQDCTKVFEIWLKEKSSNNVQLKLWIMEKHKCFCLC